MSVPAEPEAHAAASDAASSIPVESAAADPSTAEGAFSAGTLGQSVPPSSTVFSAQPDNSFEAEQALELGRLAVAQRDDAKAERLFAKSVRLKPSTEAAQELARVRRRRGASQPANRPAGGPAASSASAASAANSAAAHPPRAAPASAHAPPVPPPGPAPAAASPAFWSRHTLHAPDFLSSRFPSTRGRTLTYSYPTFFYVPPAQRKPLALVWLAVCVLCLARLLGWIDNSHARYAEPWQGRRRHFHREDDQPMRRPTPDEDGRTSSSSTWESTAYSSSSRHYSSSGGGGFLNFHNLLTLLPFLFFFVGPIVHRWMQQRQQQQAANPEPVHQY